jgi:hypothetical protein
MKRFVEGADRGESTLFPECLDDWVDKNNPVRVIDAFVGMLDLAELGWLSEGLQSFVDDPHAAIDGIEQGVIVNLTDRQAAASRQGRARCTERPEQWKRRTRRIILSLGGRNRHSGEPDSKRSRDCHLVDGHGGLPDRTPRASVSGGRSEKKPTRSRGPGPAPVA